MHKGWKYHSKIFTDSLTESAEKFLQDFLDNANIAPDMIVALQRAELTVPVIYLTYATETVWNGNLEE